MKYQDFLKLVDTIKETDLMEEKFTELLKIHYKFSEDDYKQSVFSAIIDMIKGTDLMEEKFIELLNEIDKFPYNIYKYCAFSDLAYAVNNTELMDEHYPRLRAIYDTLRPLEMNIPDRYDLRGKVFR